MLIPCLTRSFLEVTALVLLEVATIRHFRGKKLQSNLCCSHAFETFISCLTISFGEVTARVSLNLVTNDSLTDGSF